MATGPKFVLKVPLRYTLLHEIKEKKIENKKRKEARSRIVTGLIGEQSMIALG